MIPVHISYKPFLEVNALPKDLFMNLQVVEKGRFWPVNAGQA
jgi:hypothetical protein